MKRTLCLSYGCPTRLGDGEVPFCTAAALWRGIAHFGKHHALFFKAVERGVKSAGGGFAASAGGDFGADGNAVRAAAEAQDGKKDNLFEFTEAWRWAHKNYNVGHLLFFVKRRDASPVRRGSTRAAFDAHDVAHRLREIRRFKISSRCCGLGAEDCREEQSEDYAQKAFADDPFQDEHMRDRHNDPPAERAINDDRHGEKNAKADALGDLRGRFCCERIDPHPANYVNKNREQHGPSARGLIRM